MRIVPDLRLLSLVLAVVCGLLVASCGGEKASGAVGRLPSIETRATPYGQIVADRGGLSLYLYVDDSTSPPRSTCTGGCAADWPPALVRGRPAAGSGVTGKLGTVTRSDGAKQLTLSGNPLYTFAGDERPGDTRGEGVGGVWYLVTPSGSPIPFVSPTFGQPFALIRTTLGTHSSKLGRVVTDAEGQTVYLNTADHRGSSGCVASWCVQDWPPLLTTRRPTAGRSVSGRVGSIRRPDGTRQVTLDGHPLYAFAGDLVAGDVRGEGIGGHWFAIGPTGKPVSESS